MKEIPLNSVELERVYAHVADKNIRSLAVTAAEATEGTTTLTLALARRAAANQKSTLLVDFNLNNPKLSETFKIAFQDRETLEQSIAASIQSTAVQNLSVLPAPVNSKFILELRDKSHLFEFCKKLHDKFDFIIFDCSNLNAVNDNIIPAETVCRSTQTCVMSVLAGQTPENKVTEAAIKLEKAGANILGTVLNDQLNPRLIDELCRETTRLDKFSPRLMAKLRALFKKSTNHRSRRGSGNG